jgi:hypothetical protein
MIALFLLIKNATMVDIQDPGERAIFQIGNTFGFNYLVKFDGLSYVFLGNFGALQEQAVIWRLTKLLDLLAARMNAVPIRVQFGIATEQTKAVLEFFTQRLEIWLIVNGTKEEEAIKSWLSKRSLPFSLEIFTLAKTVSGLPH